MEKEFYLPTPNLNPQGGSVPAFPSLLVASIPSPLVGVSDRFPPLLWGRVRVGGREVPTPHPGPPPQGGKEEKTQYYPTRGEGGKDTDLTHKGGKEKKTQTSPNSGEGMGLLILIFQQNSSAFLKDLQPFAKFQLSKLIR